MRFLDNASIQEKKPNYYPFKAKLCARADREKSVEAEKRGPLKRGCQIIHAQITESGCLAAIETKG